MNPAGKFAKGEIVWVNTSYKHPGVRGRLPIRRKARIIRQTNDWPGFKASLFEEGYEVRYLDFDCEQARVGSYSMRLLSALEQLADAANGPD